MVHSKWLQAAGLGIQQTSTKVAHDFFFFQQGDLVLRRFRCGHIGKLVRHQGIHKQAMAPSWMRAKLIGMSTCLSARRWADRFRHSETSSLSGVDPQKSLTVPATSPIGTIHGQAAWVGVLVLPQPWSLSHGAQRHDQGVAVHCRASFRAHRHAAPMRRGPQPASSGIAHGFNCGAATPELGVLASCIGRQGRLKSGACKASWPLDSL